jgi:hypothetical protein
VNVSDKLDLGAGKDRGKGGNQIWRLTARTVGVENACHAYVDTILVVKTICQGFGDAFPLIIACAPWTDGVDVAPAANERSDIDQSNSMSNALVRRQKN